jgi:hypothetical protein
VPDVKGYWNTVGIHVRSLLFEQPEGRMKLDLFRGECEARYCNIVATISWYDW